MHVVFDSVCAAVQTRIFIDVLLMTFKHARNGAAA